MAAFIYLILHAFFSLILRECYSEVLEVTKSSFNSIRKESPFLVLFMSTKDCRKCEILFPKFMAASQPFQYDKEMVFGRISDDKLSKELDVSKFPSVILIHEGKKEPYRHEGDITVDTITEFIATSMRGDFSTVRRQYTTEIFANNYKTISEIPSLYKMLMMYRREHSEEVAQFDAIARVFKNDDEVIFMRLDIGREKSVLSEFEAKKFPAFYWYDNDEIPEKQRYGGHLDKLQIEEFIKDQTGLERKRDGELPPKAGVIKEMDELISRHVKNINAIRNMQLIIEEAKKIAEYHKQKELADYYVYLLEDIEDAQSLDIIDDERTSLNRAVAEVSDNRPKTKEALKRRRNICVSIIDAIGLHLHGGKDSPFGMRRDKKLFEMDVDQEIEILEDNSRTTKGKKEIKTDKEEEKKEHRKEHIHIHEEL